MRVLIILIILSCNSYLFGQCNTQPKVENPILYPVRLIPLLADKKETTLELFNREKGTNEKIISVYEIETWKPNDSIAKTLIADIISYEDSSKPINKIMLYYPINKYGYGEFLLDTFNNNLSAFKVIGIFTANFDNDDDNEIGLIYSYNSEFLNGAIEYRTVYYKKNKYLGVYWEFHLPVFYRITDDRFNCSKSPQKYSCSFDTVNNVINYLNENAIDRK